ncbi:MAG: hypothetical protein FWG39_01905 [Alphaproteobacteria bacterium]|nr:hypothetical protein [Alphaproteobacteria bacterium]
MIDLKPYKLSRKESAAARAVERDSRIVTVIDSRHTAMPYIEYSISSMDAGPYIAAHMNCDSDRISLRIRNNNEKVKKIPAKLDESDTCFAWAVFSILQHKYERQRCN